MSKFRKNFAKFLAILSFVIGSSLSATLVEGSDYIVLETPIANAQNSLIKIYSYDCPFCYKYDKSAINRVMQKLPNMKLIPYHLSMKGVFGNEASELFATLIMLDEASGVNLLSENSKFKRAQMALYSAYHDKKERFGGSAEFLKVGLEAAGVSSDHYNTLKADPKVKEILAKWGSGNSGDAYRIAKIQGIPAFVVKGKYLLIVKSIKSVDDMANKIQELSTLE